MNKLTIKEFYQITKISLDESLTPVDKQVKSMRVLYPDMTIEELEDLPLSKFEELLSVMDTGLDGAIEKEIRVNNKDYMLKGNIEDFDFSVRQMMIIQRKIVYDKNAYLHWMMAALYECECHTLEERAEIFLEHCDLKLSLPFVQVLMNKYQTNG